LLSKLFSWRHKHEKSWKVRNWKIVSAAALCSVLLVGAIYYTNCVYIPNIQEEQAAAADASSSDPASSKEYHYTIHTSGTDGVSSASGSSGTAAGSGNSADSRVKVTTADNGDVTINRTWDADPDELDTSTVSPDATASANIGSGGGNIVSSDGAYHGETPTTATTPSTTTSGTKTTPSGGTGSTTTTPTGGTTTSTPQAGDTRTTTSGEKQVYVDGFGWIADTSGGTSDYLDMETTGEYVGKMG